jgi:hypothetical protein
MTAAQIKARANFKKAIAYRKKTGCSLKEAFAHVKGSKVTGLDKVVKKRNKTTVLYTKKAKKKAATKKKVKQGVLFGVKKKAAKKSAVKSTHKDTKSHNVNIRVVSGIGKTKETALNNYKKQLDSIKNIESTILKIKDSLPKMKTQHWKTELKKELVQTKKLLMGYKQHAKELKKLL